MSNVCKRPPYQKNQKWKRHKQPSTGLPDDHPLAQLIAQAREIGPERMYLDWLKTQPSAYDCKFSYDKDHGQYCVPAHYRTAGNSGTGTKPPFWAIPLTEEEHREQHRIGTFAFMPRDWWLENIAIHLRRYIREKGVAPGGE